MFPRELPKLGQHRLRRPVNQAKTDLKAELFTSGRAGEVLSRWNGVLTAHAGDLVDAATIEREAAISKMFA